MRGEEEEDCWDESGAAEEREEEEDNGRARLPALSALTRIRIGRRTVVKPNLSRRAVQKG